MVSLSRLSLLSRLLRCDHFSVLSLLFAGAKRPKAWLNAINNNLRYLTATPKFATTTTWSSAQWAYYIRKYSQQFLTTAPMTYMMPYTVLRYVPQHMIEAKVNTKIVSSSFKCNLCPFASASKQQLHLHMFKTHASVHPLQMYITQHESICPICLVQFHTRIRLLENLRYKGKLRSCGDNIYLIRDSFCLSLAQEYMQHDREHVRALSKSGYRRTKAKLPAFRVPGPLRPCAQLPPKSWLQYSLFLLPSP